MSGEAARPDSQVVLTAAGPPLDFSFKELRSCSELETEEPRKELWSPRSKGRSSQEDGEASPGGDNTSPTAPGTGMAKVSFQKRVIIRKVVSSIKLNNNLLESLMGLPPALELHMGASALTNLQWLDVSFNQLVTIEPDLLKFRNLKALYLHGNCIRALPVVERLRGLTKLLSLTLNGNPVEASKIYRPFVIGALPHLKSLDHSTITEDEAQTAAAWFKGHQRRQKIRKEKLEELAAQVVE